MNRPSSYATASVEAGDTLDLSPAADSALTFVVTRVCWMFFGPDNGYATIVFDDVPIAAIGPSVPTGPVSDVLDLELVLEGGTTLQVVSNLEASAIGFTMSGYWWVHDVINS